MSRLIDPTICPDCRAGLDSTGTCAGCGLRLQGPLAAELWSHMRAADELISRLRTLAPLRAAGPEAPGTLGDPAPATPVASGGPLPAFPSPQAGPLRSSRRSPRRLPSASVPVVLLTLGALCLLVAAVVFVAVTWSVLGITGRTIVLAGLTTLFAASAGALTVRGLRGGAETVWLVVAGMLVVDVNGAAAAGLFGLDGVGWRGVGTVTGLALVAEGLVVSLWSHRQRTGVLWGTQALVIAGSLLTTLCAGWAAESNAFPTALSVVVLTALASLCLLRRLPVATWGLGVVTVLSWLVLVGIGLDRADAGTGGWSGWLLHLRGWSLLAAVGYAAAGSLLRAPSWLRSVAAGAALAVLVLFVAAPDLDEPAGVLRMAAVLGVLALVAAFAPTVWARASAVLSTLGLGAALVYVAACPWAASSDLRPEGTQSLTTPVRGTLSTADSWSVVVLAAVAVLAMACLMKFLPEGLRRTTPAAVAVAGLATMMIAAVTPVLRTEPPLWAAVLALGVVVAVLGGLAFRFRSAGLPAGSAVVGLVVSVPLLVLTAMSSFLLSGVVATVLFLVLTAVLLERDRGQASLVAAVVAVITSSAGAWAVLAWVEYAGGSRTVTSLLLAAYAVALGVAAGRAVTLTTTRVTLELSALALALTSVVDAPDEAAVAMVLTVIGTGICLVSVLEPDRDRLSWAGAAVLMVATLIRFDLDLALPEAYTLPAALLLLAVGGWRLTVQDPGGSGLEVGSIRALGSGLTLGLLPSLLLSLQDPVSLRAALLGVAAITVLGLGVQRRLSAPFLIGTVTVGLLAVRHLGPVVDAVPRWISLGLVGLLLLVVGVTWEARMQDARRAGRYLGALR